MDAPPLRVPPRVAALAERHQLGGFVAGRKGPHPVTECLTSLVIAAVLFGLAAAANWLVHLVQVKPLALLVLLLVIAGLAVAGLSFYQLFRGYTVVYRFDHGVAWTLNGRPQATAFAGIDEMYVERNAKDDTVNGAGLVTFDGRTLAIDGTPQPGYTAFVDELRDIVAAHHRPILPAHREASTQGPRGIAVGDRPIAAFSVIVGGALVAAVGVPLWQAGLPGPIAAVIGFLVIGTVIAAAGTRLDGRMAIHGAIFLAIGAIVVMVDTARALPQFNPYVVAAVVLAVEMGILSALVGLYRRLPAPRPARARRRLAARQGWQFHPVLTVPVAGPETAWKLIGVPPSAPSMDLHDAVTGTVDGVPVVVGDRFRRPPRRTDPVQTVWLAQLPLPVPLLTRSSFDFSGRQVSDGEPDPDLAGLFAGRLPRQVSAEAGVPLWWMEGRFILCHGAGDPRKIVAWSTMLAAFVAGAPWSDVHRFLTQRQPTA